jgi:hypothetical protein
MRLRPALLRISRLLDRTTADRAELFSSRRSVALPVLFAVLTVLLVGMWFPPLVAHFARWYKLHPDIPTTKLLDWRVIYGSSPEPCPAVARGSHGCLANPDEPGPWKKSHNRFEDDEAEERHEDRVVKRLWKDYWLKVAIPPELLAEARAKRVTQFLVGHFYSSYRVWIDGVFVKEGTGVLDPIPLFLPLSAENLASKRPLQIVMQIIFDNEKVPVDHFSNNYAQGFVKASTADRYILMMSFGNRARPISLFLAYALIGALFFFLWLPARHKQEYFYMALLAIAAGAWEARYIDFIERAIDRDVAANLCVVLRAYLIGFILLLSLAVARVRHDVMRILFALTLIAPVLFVFTIPTVDGKIAVRDFLQIKGTTAIFAVAAFFCGLRAWALAASSSRFGHVPPRVRSLALFATGLLVAGIVNYLVESKVFYLFTHRAFLRGFEWLGLMLYLAALALREYAADEALVQDMPVSDYHRRPVLPESLKGALLAIDLKSSEPLYRQRAITASVDLVTAWRSQVYSAALRSHGTIVSKKGDEVLVFFDADKSPRPSETALRVFVEVARASELLAAEFRRQGLFPPQVEGFHFRAALSEGAIRPIWEDVAGRREAYWEEAGDTMTFVEASRLMDIERKITETSKTISMLVMDERSATSVQEQPGIRFVARERTFPDKHGTAHRVAACVVEGSEASREKGVAA